MLPGIGPLAGISILLPLTFGLDATKAVIMLAGIYYGSQYGGSTTSILMRIPGEAASVMTCIDGYAMAQQGPRRRRARHRRGRLVRRRHLRRHPAHAAGAAARHLSRCASARPNTPRCSCSASSSSPTCRRLADPHADHGGRRADARHDRHRHHDRPLPLFSFDLKELGDGVGIVPVAVGLFGLGEILATPSKAVTGKVIAPKLRELMPTRQEWREAAMPIARGSVLGFLIGIIPGSAHIISSFLSYGAGTPALEDAGRIRQGRGRRRRRPGIGQQRGLDRRVRADARARPPDRPGHRGADRRADGARRLRRARS